MANQSFSGAQFNLGMMYRNCEGVHQNKATAKEFFDKSCDNGYQNGCNIYLILNQK